MKIRQFISFARVFGAGVGVAACCVALSACSGSTELEASQDIGAPEGSRATSETRAALAPLATSFTIELPDGFEPAEPHRMLVEPRAKATFELKPGDTIPADAERSDDSAADKVEIISAGPIRTQPDGAVDHIIIEVESASNLGAEALNIYFDGSDL